MTCNVGYNSYIGFAQETSYGTAALPAKYLEYNSESLKTEKEEILIDAINGTPQFKKRVTGQKSVGGTIEFPVVPGSILQLLDYAVGSITTSALNATSFQHRFLARVGPQTLSSYTFEVGRNAQDTQTVKRYTGCNVSNMNFNMAVNDVLKCSMDLMGKDEVTGTTISTASFRTYAPYVFKNATIKIGENSGTATQTGVESIAINIGNNSIEDYELGSALRARVCPGMQDITMEFTATYNTASVYNRFINETQSYISAAFDSGVSIDATYTHKITFEAWNCYFNGDESNISDGTSLRKATYPVRSIYDGASTSALMVTVISDLASLTA